jgi:predicted RNA binding protein YcfA (HicA-like mRNA interferase family)
MRHLERKKVEAALKSLGFYRTGKMKHGGHVEYMREVDHKCCVCNTRKPTVGYENVYALGNELETKGIIGRRDFINLVKTI